MTAFRHSAESLAKLATDDSVLEKRLSEAIAEHLRRTVRVNPSQAERGSWDRSLPILARDLVDAGLGDVEMLVEYRLPLTSKRADVVLAGVDSRTGDDVYVVVELKQWSRAELFEEDPKLVLVEGVPGGPRLHPVLQVEGYCDYIGDFVGAVEGRGDMVRGVAYLHNAADLDIQDLYAGVRSERTRLAAAPSSTISASSSPPCRARTRPTGCSTVRSGPPGSFSNSPPRRSEIASSSSSSPNSDWRTRSS